MLKNLFNRGKSQVEQNADKTPAQSAVREFKPTRKKKNTYIVNLNTMTMPGAFEQCPDTPLAIIKINGVETENAHGGFMSCTQFPNPGASTIDVLYHKCPEWRIIMGVTASTIIEYMDKESGKPALILYPNGQVQSRIPNEDESKVIFTRLNHASRRDFIYQFNRIMDLIDIARPVIDVRKQAMQHAPAERDYEAYTKFIAELDKQQIERAKQIVAQRQK